MSGSGRGRAFDSECLCPTHVAPLDERQIVRVKPSASRLAVVVRLVGPGVDPARIGLVLRDHVRYVGGWPPGQHLGLAVQPHPLRSKPDIGEHVLDGGSSCGVEPIHLPGVGHRCLH